MSLPLPVSAHKEVPPALHRFQRQMTLETRSCCSTRIQNQNVLALEVPKHLDCHGLCLLCFEVHGGALRTVMRAADNCREPLNNAVRRKQDPMIHQVHQLASFLCLLYGLNKVDLAGVERRDFIPLRLLPMHLAHPLHETWKQLLHRLVIAAAQHVDFLQQHLKCGSFTKCIPKDGQLLCLLFQWFAVEATAQ